MGKLTNSEFLKYYGERLAHYDVDGVFSSMLTSEDIIKEATKTISVIAACLNKMLFKDKQVKFYGLWNIVLTPGGYVSSRECKELMNINTMRPKVRINKGLKKALASSLVITENDAKVRLLALVEVVQAALVSHKEVVISGLGNWKLTRKSERRLVISRIGYDHIKSSRDYVKFKVSDTIKRDANALSGEEASDIVLNALKLI